MKKIFLQRQWNWRAPKFRGRPKQFKISMKNSTKIQKPNEHHKLKQKDSASPFRSHSLSFCSLRSEFQNKQKREEKRWGISPFPFLLRFQVLQKQYLFSGLFVLYHQLYHWFSFYCLFGLASIIWNFDTELSLICIELYCELFLLDLGFRMQSSEITWKKRGNFLSGS